MDTVAIIVAAALAAVLVARELMWRRAFAALRERIASDGLPTRRARAHR